MGSHEWWSRSERCHECNGHTVDGSYGRCVICLCNKYMHMYTLTHTHTHTHTGNTTTVEERGVEVSSGLPALQYGRDREDGAKEMQG